MQQPYGNADHRFRLELPKLMRKIFKIFFNVEGTKPVVVLLCLLLGGFAEAIGIGSLLPVIGTVLTPDGGEPSTFERYLQMAFDLINLTPTFTNLVVAVVIIMILRSALLFGAMSYAGFTAARVSNMFRTKIIKSLLAARWNFYANQSAGRLATSIGNDARGAGEAYIIFATVAACCVQILAYSTIALLINWKVATLAILGGLVISVLSAKLISIAKRASYKQTDRIGIISADMLEMLHNIKALKSMNRAEPMLAHLSQVLKKLKKNIYTAVAAKYGLTYGNDVLVVLLVGLGAYFSHIHAGIPLPEMFVFGVLFFQVINYCSKLVKQVQLAALYEAAYIRVNEVLEGSDAAKEINTGSTVPNIKNGIQLQNITFSHAEKPVLQNLNIEIPANAITVIQGPSGAGKTTVLDLLVGLLRPQHGVVKIGSDDLNDVDIKAWRKTIGYVPQELSLFHDSIRTNITLYDEAITEDAIQNSVALAGINAFVDQLPNGIETDVGEGGAKLSGGQRQRISLARALVTNPKFLILDEVTSALDPATEDEIVANIAQLRGRYTIVAITHRPAWTRIADRLYALENGKAKLVKVSGKKKSK
jgi:ATP-binding cassette, subfamily C, bacterial